MDSTKDFGMFGESIAANYLEKKGYTILARNYQKPWGEIDIIAKQDDVVVFIEVKSNARDLGYEFNPEVRVDEKKLNKITKTAALYLEYEYGTMDTEWRVDIVAVTIIEDERKAKITHFKNVAEAWN